MNIISNTGRRSYDDFKQQIPKQVQPLFDTIREFCLSINENVIEDVRMHRVVFCKSMSFRWFADVEPTSNGVIIKIQQDRRLPIQTIQIETDQDISKTMDTIRDAHKTIH